MTWPEVLTSVDALARWLLRELGWTTLASATVALAVWGILRIWRRLPPHWRLALWALVFLRLLVPVSASHRFSLRAGLDDLRTAIAPVVQWASGTDEGAMLSAGGVSLARAAGTRRKPPAIPVASLVLLGWAAGAIAVFARYRRRLAAFQEEAHSAPNIDAPAVRVMIEEWRARFQIRRPVRAVAIAGTSPYTVGLVRPIIAIPERLLRPECEAHLGPVIAHELAHVRRWDAAAIALQNLLGAVYFFNPTIRLADRHMNLSRECVCDGMVLAHRTITPFEYGRSLLAVLRDTAAGPGAEVAGMSLRSEAWMQRIASLRADVGVPRRGSMPARIVPLLVATLVFPMGAVSRTHTTATTDVPSYPGVGRPTPAQNAQATDPRRAPLDPTKWSSPLRGGRLTSPFGERHHPVTGKPEFHAGVDLAAPRGTPVLAAADGTATVIEKTAAPPDAGKITTVKIAHAAGYVTYYFAVDAVRVVEGQAVKRGEPIAAVGVPPGTSGAHLHFAVTRDGHPIDPLPLIRFRGASEAPAPGVQR